MALLRNIPFVTVVLVIVIGLLGWLGLEIPPQFSFAFPDQIGQPTPAASVVGLVSAEYQGRGDRPLFVNSSLPCVQEAF